jgi:hypothetical protein
MATTPVQIPISDLTAKVNAGWKKLALAAHYGIPVTQMTQALQGAGLRIRKFHHPKFQLVDDTQAVSPVIAEATIQGEIYAHPITMDMAVPVHGSVTWMDAAEPMETDADYFEDEAEMLAELDQRVEQETMESTPELLEDVSAGEDISVEDATEEEAIAW